MATHKKIRRRLKFEAVCVTAFLLAGLFYMGTYIFLRSYNVSVAVATQNVETEIKRIEQENASLSVQVQELLAYERVAAIATEDGMTLNQENIVTMPDKGE